MTGPWESDSLLTAEVEAQFGSAIAAYQAKPTLIAEHANHEESIRTGGYANRTLLELVQNAADAMTGASTISEDGRVEIVLDPDKGILYCANSGRPFSRSGLVAITHAHLSAKRGDEIGRFGLGFKSVLAVSDRPQVLSRSVSFEFNSAEAQSAVQRIAASSRRLPILRTATVLDPHLLIDSDPIVAKLSSWATTVVRLPGIKNSTHLRREMETFSSEFLLFVSAVREIRLKVLGEEGFATSHVSRELGDGRFRIERPDGNGDEWLISEQMHRPSIEARREVGETVSRDEIKVSVAVPVRPRRANPEAGDPGTQVGQFWSYFPLQDRTSATGFFNAPWSVNDDRTNLLRNQYNKEILATLAHMFTGLLPRLSTHEDPAAHLDYLPARGREAIYFGDEILCAMVPRSAVEISIIPDGEGHLRSPTDLRPLDFFCDWRISEIAHQGWSISPNTNTNVPHWRCYATSQRVTRLRQLFAVSADPDRFEMERRDLARALQRVPQRGILSWLREWAEGTDVQSSANALRVVLQNRGSDEARQARVIPTSDGMRSLGDRDFVFLARHDELEIEGAVFVTADFLAYPEMETVLRDAGFRDLGPFAILSARLSQLISSRDPELQAKFWQAAQGVAPKEALDAVRKTPTAQILVPTLEGTWHWPQRVLDFGYELPGADRGMLLDRTRCVAPLARMLGVISGPVRDFSMEDEFAADQYQEWVRADLNGRLSPGERRIERIELYPPQAASPGPFSVLLLLKETGASDQLRESWTRELLAFGDDLWECEDTATGVSYRVSSPVRWAVEQAGLLKTSRGFRSPPQVVAPSLVRYKDLLPLFEGPRGIVDILHMPDEISDVPADVLADALAVEVLPSQFSDNILVEFIIEASRIAFPGLTPPRIPARVGRILESRPTRTVYVATNDEQQEYLRQRQRPYLLARDEQAELLIKDLGCLRFEDSFTFSTKIDGQQEPEDLLDVFTGLRRLPSSAVLSNIMLARAASIAKWVTTQSGRETQSLKFHQEGLTFIVQSDLDERQVLRLVSENFELRLNSSDIETILKAGLDDRLELIRQDALAASDDASRLEKYFGDDDLREKLPKGLWSGLKSRGLVSNSTSVAELCFSVYGTDTIRELADLFRNEGFPDVPSQWAGGAATISWLRRMGFGPEFAGRRTIHQDSEFLVPGATILSPLHDYQNEISGKLRQVLNEEHDGRHSKAMLELPTGAGKTRVAVETIAQMFIDSDLSGTILWIAQSQELCEQAIQTFSHVWRGLCAEQSIDAPMGLARLWSSHEVHKPDTAFSVIVATDAKLQSILERPDHSDYDWLATPQAVIIDEGHVAGTSPRYTRILNWLGVDGRRWERPLVGLSATPFKGTSVEATKALAARFGNNRLKAFGDDQNVYKELVKIGVLARVKHEVLPGGDVELTTLEADEVRRTNRVNVGVLDKVAENHQRMSNLVNSIRSLDDRRGRSVLVFTPNVLSAQVLAATLRFHDIEAAAVSGQTGVQERREVIRRFKEGQIQVLANCDLLTQGFDAPGVTALYIARPTFSPNAYIQMAGRGLRGPKNGGKEECLIIDLDDNFGSEDINNLLGFHEYTQLWQEQRP